MKRNLILTCWVVMTIAVLPKAHDVYAIEGLKGNWSLGLYGAYNQSEIDTLLSDTYTYNLSVLNASIGYFFTDHVEVNFSPTIASAEGEDSEMSLYNYFGNVVYNFYDEKWQTVPYAGIQAGSTRIRLDYQDTDEDASDDSDVSYSDTSYSFGFLGGVKVFLSENLSLDVEYNWLYSPDLVADLTMTTLFFGFTWYFGGE